MKIQILTRWFSCNTRIRRQFCMFPLSFHWNHILVGLIFSPYNNQMIFKTENYKQDGLSNEKVFLGLPWLHKALSPPFPTIVRFLANNIELHLYQLVSFYDKPRVQKVESIERQMLPRKNLVVQMHFLVISRQFHGNIPVFHWNY